MRLKFVSRLTFPGRSHDTRTLTRRSIPSSLLPNYDT
jgi:hypothetical protein